MCSARSSAGYTEGLNREVTTRTVLRVIVWLARERAGLPCFFDQGQCSVYPWILAWVTGGLVTEEGAIGRQLVEDASLDRPLSFGVLVRRSI